jgi:hypothetical protein
LHKILSKAIKLLIETIEACAHLFNTLLENNKALEECVWIPNFNGGLTRSARIS